MNIAFEKELILGSKRFEPLIISPLASKSKFLEQKEKSRGYDFVVCFLESASMLR